MKPHRRCYFCKYSKPFTRLIDYRVGPTGKRGFYQRRICTDCERSILDQRNIRSPWKRTR
jgi:hypothetical protein